MIDAQEAWRIGLVNRLVPGADLMAEAEKLLRTILEQGPLAVAAVLEAIDAAFEMPAPQALLLEANHFGLLSSTGDMREGMAAFLEKRKADFRGV
jgi:enoyl-CoA hydratase